MYMRVECNGKGFVDCYKASIKEINYSRRERLATIFAVVFCS